MSRGGAGQEHSSCSPCWSGPTESHEWWLTRPLGVWICQISQSDGGHGISLPSRRSTPPYSVTSRVWRQKEGNHRHPLFLALFLFSLLFTSRSVTLSSATIASEVSANWHGSKKMQKHPVWEIVFKKQANFFFFDLSSAKKNKKCQTLLWHVNCVFNTSC